jgi:hypothetical protein
MYVIKDWRIWRRMREERLELRPGGRRVYIDRILEVIAALISSGKLIIEVLHLVDELGDEFSQAVCVSLEIINIGMAGYLVSYDVSPVPPYAHVD